MAVGDGIWLIVGPEGARVQANHEVEQAHREDVLRGPGEGLLAHVRGAAVLHGSCVLHHGRGVCIVGPAGAGKSTLTAWLARSGAELVSDGITLADPDSRRLFWRRPQWRLHDDSLEFLGERPDLLPFDDPARCKRRLVAATSVARRTDVVLDVVFVLQEGHDVKVVDVLGMDQILALVRDWYLASSLPTSESPVVLERASRLLRAGLRVAKLVRPKHWAAFPAVADAVQDYLGRFRQP